MIDYSSILEDIKVQYLSDNYPWIIGYSGGKDSTTVLQFIFQALSTIPKKDLKKEVHVVFNDTLVENPIIDEYIDDQLAKIETAGKNNLFSHRPELFSVKKVNPKLEDRFWINLIGKGYPSPNLWFRWCTERLKINPTSDYIKATLRHQSKVIIVLGTRIAESRNRAKSMKKYSTKGRLKDHKLSNVFVFTPIENLSNDAVWAYLLQARNLWGANNRDLLKLYGSACDDGECPFVVETGTQSCGKSRFGCWVCTVVDRDKSMENFVDNGHAWMKDLLDFRNWLYQIRQQDSQYVPRYLKDRVRFGPFLLKTRQLILSRLIDIQEKFPIVLISSEELLNINKILEIESLGKEKDGLRKYIFEIPNQGQLAVISDFNILLSSRERLASIYLKNAKLLKSRNVSLNHSNSARVMYYNV